MQVFREASRYTRFYLIMVLSIDYSFTPPLNHPSITHSLINSFFHSFTFSFIHSSIQSVIYSSTHSFIHPFTHSTSSVHSMPTG